MTDPPDKDGARDTSDAAAQSVRSQRRWRFGVNELLVLAATSAFVVAVFFGMYPFSLFSLPVLPLVVVVDVLAVFVFPRVRYGISEIIVIAGVLYALATLAASGCVDLKEWSRKSACANNVKAIMLALHNYHDRYGSFPPAYLADKDGRPMHSWRVLILPFLDQGAIYDKYRFDESWNGPNNRRLYSARVPTYECPQHGYEGTATSYVAVLGPETAWPAATSVRLSEIRDGTANTLMVAEVAESGIHWMEPRDMEAATMPMSVNSNDGGGISSLHRETSWRARLLGAHVGFADGHVQFLPTNTSAKKLRPLLTISGRETVDWDDKGHD